MTATRQRDDVIGGPRKFQTGKWGARCHSRNRPVTAHRSRSHVSDGWASGAPKTTACRPRAGPPGEGHAWSRGGCVSLLSLLFFHKCHLHREGLLHNTAACHINHPNSEHAALAGVGPTPVPKKSSPLPLRPTGPGVPQGPQTGPGKLQGRWWLALSCNDQRPSPSGLVTSDACCVDLCW